MTHDLIHVRPRRDQRVAFARWAVSQRPKVRTTSAEEFGVPPVLFVDMPEDLLRGSLVDGRPYVSPLDHEETEAAPAGAPELTGVVGPRLLSCGLCYEENGEEVHPHPECTVAPLDGLREAAPGQPLPEVPAAAYGPDAVPLPPPEDAPEDTGDTDGDTLAPGGDTAGETPAVTSEDTPGDTGDTSEDTAGDKPYGCDRCPRTFTTERGRSTHRAMVHGR